MSTDDDDALVSGTLDCANCGQSLATPHADGLWYDGDALTCPDCRAVNHVFVEEEDDGEDGGSVHISFYDCRHGKRDDEACDLCEIEDGTGVGEVDHV